MNGDSAAIAWSRRAFLAALGLSVTCTAVRPARAAAAADDFRVLRARPSQVALQGSGRPPTPLWTFDGLVPGPLLRVTRGAELRFRVANELPALPRLHWHGVRLGSALGGVAHLTGAPTAAGEEREYRFMPPDAGTFWYRAFGASQAEARGLHGLLLVDEVDPVQVDRDVALVFDEWRIAPDGALDAAGREQITVNGGPVVDIPVSRNERLRLRLLNASGARLFGVSVEQHRPLVMAIDGQPAEPFAARDGRIVLAPGNRADLFVDAGLAPGASAAVALTTTTASAPVARLVYRDDPPVRAQPLPEPRPLPANPLPERMGFTQALRLDLALDPAAVRSGGRNAPAVPLWAPLNRESLRTAPPVFSAQRGRTVMLAFRNPAAAPQIVHLHGHHFRLLDALDDGWKPFWLDTLTVMPGQTARIAFVADNPGRWLLEARMLEQDALGMAAVFEVR